MNGAIYAFRTHVLFDAEPSLYGDRTVALRDARALRPQHRRRLTRTGTARARKRSSSTTMDLEAHRDLKLLEAVQQDSHVTQRGLANKLGIALGLANIYLKRLMRKGYIKCVNVQPNRISYLITPRGIAEKARLTYEFMDYSLHLYKEVRQHLREVAAGVRGAGSPGRDLRARRGRRARVSVAEGIGPRTGRDLRRRRRPGLSRHAGAADRRARRRRPTT